jgi:hypothetical protein
MFSAVHSSPLPQPSYRERERMARWREQFPPLGAAALEKLDQPGESAFRQCAERDYCKPDNRTLQWCEGMAELRWRLTCGLL